MSTNEFELVQFENGMRARFRQLIAVTRLEAESVVVNAINEIFVKQDVALTDRAPRIPARAVHAACGGEQNFCTYEDFQEVLTAVAHKWPGILIDRRATPESAETSEIYWVGLERRADG